MATAHPECNVAKSSTAESLSLGAGFTEAWAELSANDLDRPGPEWFTRKQLETVWGIRKAQAVVRIARMLDAGKIEMDMFDSKVGNRYQPIPHYRIIK